MADRRGFIGWIGRHKKGLIIAGIGIGVVILGFLGAGNSELIVDSLDRIRKSLEKLPEVDVIENATAKVAVKAVPVERVVEAVKLEQVVTTVPTRQIMETASFEQIAEVVVSEGEKPKVVPFMVRKHIRNLPEGWQASAEKIEEAMKEGVTLQEGQTLVDGYMKGVTAA